EGRHGGGAHRRPGAIERIRRRPEPDRPAVTLVLEEQPARDLRRLADAEREQSAGERVERPEMADLRAAKARLQRANDAGRRRTFRLVDEEKPVQAHSPSSSRFVPRRRSSTRCAVSGAVSYSNRSSGVTRSPRACPTSPRRKWLARASAFMVVGRVLSPPSVRTYTRATRR